jgi:TolA-binding protein
MPKSVSYKTNSIVYFKGDINEKIYILNKGRVSLNYNDIETGQEMHELIKTGEFFGVKSAMGKYPREETAVVLQDSTMIAFSVSEFEQIVLKNTRIMIKMLKVFSNQLRRIHKQVRNLLRSGNDINDPETGLFNIGEYYLKARKKKQAIYALRRYLTYYPSGKYASEASSHLEGAESGATTGNVGSSFSATSSTRQVGSDLSDVAKSYYNAVSLFSQEKFKESLTGFQKIIEEGADGEYEAKARYEIGRCQFNLQKFELCIKHFTSLIQKYPKHPDLIEALFYVGRSYEEMSTTEKAAGFYKKVISMAKDEAPILRKAKKALNGLGGR